MKKICLLICTALVVLPVVPASAAFKQAILQYLVGESVLDKCTAKLAEMDIAYSHEQMQESLAVLKSAMVEEARGLHPEMSAEDINAGIESYLSSGRSEVQNAIFIRDSCPTEVISQSKQLFEMLEPSDFSAKLASDRSRYQPDELQKFDNSSTSAKTYAYDQTRYNILTGGVELSFQPDRCKSLDVLSADILSRKIETYDNTPVFISPVFAYSEKWAVSCDGKVKHFVVTFGQDSEGGVGLYSSKLAE